ncbi:reverse transcriptase domain-containing protein [Tanacetum coccineum]
MEQYLALLRENQAPCVVKPEIEGNVNFEIKSQFMRELREDNFSKNKNEDAHDHIDRVLNIVSLFNIPRVSKAAVMLRVFPFTLTGSAKRWVDRLTPRAVNTWDLLKKAFIQRTSSRNISNNSNTNGFAAIVSKLDNLRRDMKKLKENVHAIQVGCQICEGPHLDKECPLNEEVKPVEEVKYGEFGCPAPFNRSNGTKFRVGPPGYYTRTDNQTPSGEKRPNLVKTINKYMEGATKRQAEQDEWPKTFCQNTEKIRIDHDKIIQKLKSQVKTLTAEVETKVAKLEGCKTIFAYDGTPLYTPFYYSSEEIEYFSANSGFSDDKNSESTKLKTSKVIPELKSNLPEQTVNHYVKPYVPPIPFPNRLKQHAEEALVHKTMESLKKIKINRPLLKEIRQTDNYPKYMKDLMASKQLTKEDDKVRMNSRCSALLQNQLPPKENDPGSFILPCFIRRLDFNNALADLGASISIMPFSMFKRLGIGKLEPIDMVIEMADDTKCIPKGIVKNMLIKNDKFILPVDFVILDMIEDFRMPVILGRPLLDTAHTKVDVFRKAISLEVGNEKVIFKMRSNFSDNIHESVRMIKTKMNIEEDELMKIDSDLFTYNTNACEINHLLSIDPDVFTYDIEVQESCEEIVYRCSLITQEANGALSPFEEKCDGGSLCHNEIKCYWESENDGKRIYVEWENLSLNDWLRISEDFEYPDGCRESKENEILGTIINKLHDEWFKGTHEDDDDLEGIIDYLEPILYDGFIDSDDEEYKERKCRLLGMPYIKPPLFLIEKVKVTRYSVGPGEVYTKIKVSEVEELSRTRRNIATIRAGIMEEILGNDDDKESYDETFQQLGDNLRDRLDPKMVRRLTLTLMIYYLDHGRPPANASDEKEVVLKSRERNLEKMGSDARVSRSVPVESGCCVVVCKVVERLIIARDDAIVGFFTSEGL